MVDFVDKTSESNGTPINRKNLMALQGFQYAITRFNDDGTITQTNENGDVLTVSFLEDGTIKEEFVGEKKITKYTMFADGEIREDFVE